MAFLDYIYRKSDLDRLASVFMAIQEVLLRVGIRVRIGKDPVVEQIGCVPTGAQALTEAAQRLDPEAIVWCGDVCLPPLEQGVMVFRHPEFVRSRLAAVSAEHDRLVSQIVGRSTVCVDSAAPLCSNQLQLMVVHPALSAGLAGVPRCDHASGSRHLHATCAGMSSASHFHEVGWAFEVQF